jgi:hypothetical protein
MKDTFCIPFLVWIASATCPAQTLAVSIHDYSGLSEKETLRLTGTVDLVFANSGFTIAWRHCRGALASPPHATCESELQDNEIVMRLQPGLPRRANRDQSFHAGEAIVLGRATVAGAGGYYASVSVQAVRQQAAEFSLPFDRLMGYAVAHEVGHCLLGPGHSYAGLMRAAWNRKDAEAINRLSLHLTKEENRKAVARLSLAKLPAQK